VKEVYILVDGQHEAFGRPVRLYRVEERDGQVEGCDYLYCEDGSWECDYGGYYAGRAPDDDLAWGYLIEFYDRHYGSVQIGHIHEALATCGARFDPDPPI
jgi:hypothetical protein